MKNSLYFKNLISNSKFCLIEIYLYFAFIGILASLGSNLGNLTFKNNNIVNLLIDFRSLIPWIVLSINVVILVNVFIKKKNFDFNPIIYFFLIYISLQIIGCYLNNLKTFYFHFIVGSLSFISLIIIVLNINKKYLQNLIKIFLGLILGLVIYFLINNPTISYGSNVLDFGNNIITTINSNGFSRYLVILYIFFLVKLFLQNKNIFYLLILLILFSTIIHLYEGRFNIFIVFLFSAIIFFKKTSIKNKIITFLFITILPFFLSLGLSIFIFSHSEIKSESASQKTKIEIYKEKVQNVPTNRYAPNKEKYFSKNDYLKYSKNNLNEFTTGRISKWKIMIQQKQSNLTKFFGNGPEHDRNSLGDIFYGNDAANSLVYIYLSGGLISTFFVLLLFFNQLINLYKKVFNIYLPENEFIFFALLVFVFIAARGLLENGFAAWGMDQIIFILFGSLVNFNVTKKIL